MGMTMTQKILANQMQNHILAGHVGLELSGQRDLNRGGHTEPAQAGSHTSGHIGRAYASGERAQRTIGAGMGVRADDDFTGGA